MKRSDFRMPLLCGVVLFAALAILGSCTNPTSSTPTNRTISVVASGFPDLASGYHLYVAAYKVNDTRTNLFDLGAIVLNTTVTKDLVIDGAAVQVDLLLVDSNNKIKFWDAWDVSDGSVSKVVTEFWVDNDYLNTSKKYRFGVSSANIQALPLGKKLDFNFSTVPYYLYKLDKAKDKPLRITLDNTDSNVTIAKSELLSYVTGYNTGYGALTNLTFTSTSLTNDIKATGDTLYLFVYKSDYTKKASVTAQIDDYSNLVALTRAQNFTPGEAVSFDAKDLYFTSSDSSTSLTLKKWEYATGTVTKVKEFDDPIGAMIKDGSRLLIGAGRLLYSYDPATGTASVVATLPSTISTLALYGTNNIVARASSASSSLYLVNRSNSAVSTVDTFYSFDNVLVPITSKNRIYSYVNYNYLGYQELDSTPAFSGSAVYESTTSSSSFSRPLKQLGTELKVMTSTGDIYALDDTGVTSGIKRSGTLQLGTTGLKIVDFVALSDPDRIVVLANKLSGSSVSGTLLISLNRTTPFAEITRTDVVTGEEGYKMIESGSNLFMVTRMLTSQTLFGESFAPVKVRKYEVSTSGLTAKSLVGPADHFEALTARGRAPLEP